jgi:hypothetical protein
MGSLERRIEGLEKLYGASPGESDPGEREKRRAKFLALVERVSVKAAREQEQGDTRRQRALDELLEWGHRRGA